MATIGTAQQTTEHSRMYSAVTPYALSVLENKINSVLPLKIHVNLYTKKLISFD